MNGHFSARGIAPNFLGKKGSKLDFLLLSWVEIMLFKNRWRRPDMPRPRFLASLSRMDFIFNKKAAFQEMTFWSGFWFVIAAFQLFCPIFFSSHPIFCKKEKKNSKKIPRVERNMKKPNMVKLFWSLDLLNGIRGLAAIFWSVDFKS